MESKDYVSVTNARGEKSSSAAAIKADREFTESLLQRIESWDYITETLIPFVKGLCRSLFLFRNPTTTYLLDWRCAIVATLDDF